MPVGDSLPRLVEIMDRLLAPDGCPWDREQTLATLRPFLIEETYEVLDAIEQQEPAAHCEELGDLLMQIVFQAALAARRADHPFDVDQVIAGISDKLMRRHPHVFGDGQKLADPNAVLVQWEQIKQTEKANQKRRTLDGVPRGPALVRAQKLSHKAAKVGFDWPSWEGSLEKIVEETNEVAEAARAGDPARCHEEIGDLLFAAVNLARKLGVDPELALLDTTRKFYNRFSYIEDELAARGKSPAQSDLAEMDNLWNQAKAHTGALTKT